MEKVILGVNEKYLRDNALIASMGSRVEVLLNQLNSLL